MGSADSKLKDTQPHKKDDLVKTGDDNGLPPVRKPVTISGGEAAEVGL